MLTTFFYVFNYMLKLIFSFLFRIMLSACVLFLGFFSCTRVGVKQRACTVYVTGRKHKLDIIILKVEPVAYTIYISSSLGTL